MAEVHILGQLVGASGFPRHSLFCKWALTTGGGWKLLEGRDSGQTQTDNPQYEEYAHWAHPIDAHYATKGLQGWPKLHVEVWHMDAYGRVELYGYGFAHVPTSPGQHSVECAVWRPAPTSYAEQLTQFFLGGSAVLRHTDLVYTGAVDRSRLQTVSMGTVHATLNVVTRHFAKYGVELA